jgi:hypothetical protein
MLNVERLGLFESMQDVFDAGGISKKVVLICLESTKFRPETMQQLNNHRLGVYRLGIDKCSLHHYLENHPSVLREAKGIELLAKAKL